MAKPTYKTTLEFNQDSIDIIEDLQTRLGLTKKQVIEDALGEYHERRKPNYCTQNSGFCTTCSLVNYGKDCRNNPVKQ